MHYLLNVWDITMVAEMETLERMFVHLVMQTSALKKCSDSHTW